jgi:hypothetical protein
MDLQLIGGAVDGKSPTNDAIGEAAHDRSKMRADTGVAVERGEAEHDVGEAPRTIWHLKRHDDATESQNTNPDAVIVRQMVDVHLPAVFSYIDESASAPSARPPSACLRSRCD